ncbi:hypothetical protein AAFN46_18745 [Pseudomonas sp. CAU 1711]|uniref:hypothetical protein n=1 Tax=Pseudomonas sp. CAU 1711 TaxID=3140356 RepID=UPI0032617F5A
MGPLIKLSLALAILITSTTSYASDFCDKVNETTYRDETYLTPPGQIYRVTGPDKLYLYSAPNRKCSYGENIFLIENDKVQAYTEFNEFLSIMYFREDGETIEGWALKKQLSQTNERISP